MDWLTVKERARTCTQILFKKNPLELKQLEDPNEHETLNRFRENYALSNGYTLGSESCENLEHLEQLDHFWCPNTAEVDFFERKFQNCIESLQIDSRLDIHRIYAFWAVDFFFPIF